MNTHKLSYTMYKVTDDSNGSFIVQRDEIKGLWFTELGLIGTDGQRRMKKIGGFSLSQVRAGALKARRISNERFERYNR